MHIYPQHDIFYVFKLKCCYACRIQIKHNTEQRMLPHWQEIKAHLYHSATDDSAGTGEDKETLIHECLNAEKLLAMAGNSLTFFPCATEEFLILVRS